MTAKRNHTGHEVEYVRATPEIEHHLNLNPRVVSYTYDSTDDLFRLVIDSTKSCGTFRLAARDLGIESEVCS